MASLTGFSFYSFNAIKFGPVPVELNPKDFDYQHYVEKQLKPIAVDVKHSQNENRWFALGQTESDRKLFLVFTIRKNQIRVISARDMNKKERREYNEEIKKDSSI